MRRRRLLFALLLFISTMAVARASERITLTNGFVENCHHHANLETSVRLYLSASEDSYIDLASDQIASIETVPDPAVTVQSVAASQAANAHLTPADLNEMLNRAGEQHNIDMDLLASVVKAESNGNSRAVSHAGAQGLMQLMPQTAAGLGVQNSFEPGQNVQGGSTYLDALLTRYRDNLALALAAYNAGPEAVDKYHGIPPYRETQVYVARVIHEFNRRVLSREALMRKTGSTASSHASPQ